jgi:hypothetical protein
MNNVGFVGRVRDFFGRGGFGSSKESLALPNLEETM